MQNLRPVCNIYDTPLDFCPWPPYNEVMKRIHSISFKYRLAISYSIILALILNKKYRIPVHISLYAIDLTVLLLQIPLRNVLQIFYGLVATALSSMVLNKTLTAGSSLSQILVVSDRYEAIRDAVLHQLDAGVTLLASEKGYSGQRSRILLTVVPYRKLPALRACINGIDPMAFVIVSHVDEVGGQGFSLARL